MEDTIIAIATPMGHSMQSIIRLSGPKSISLINKIFNPKKNLQHVSNYRSISGWIVLSSPPLELPVTLYLMKAPKSYTREDVVEIHTMGIPALLDMLLNYFTRKGARLARPGEFTHRAFLNGRIDLAQAEAVLNIIKARNNRDLTLANRQLTGTLSRQLNQLKDSLKELLAVLELSLDFSDHDIVVLSEKEIKSHIHNLIKEISNLLKSREESAVFKEAISIVLCGKPNVGKSSLFNRLVQANRAIVTSIAGTTRDVIECDLSVGGWKLGLFDTAGLGKKVGNNESELQQIVSQKTEKTLQNADIFLLLLDGNKALTKEDLTIFNQLDNKRIGIIINKRDLPQKITTNQAKRMAKQFGFICRCSAMTGQGINELRNHIKYFVSQLKTDKSTSPQIINARTRTSLKAVLDRLSHAQSLRLPELIAFEIHEALDELGNITGATTPDDVLNQIFSRFCIGK